MIQVPILALSALLIFTFVRYDTPAQQTSKATKPSLSRVDWSGALTILLAVSSLLVCLSFKTNENRPISDPRVWATGASAVFFLLLFIFCEIHVAKEPVLPMRLMTARSPRGSFLSPLQSHCS